MRMYNEAKLKVDKNANCGRPYQQCELSVMDTIADPDITFDDQGISNYYYQYLQLASSIQTSVANAEQSLQAIIDNIKTEGKGKQYDCITGVSGGVDSSYLILMAKKWGLRPLIVHFDNGWNSETAVGNIHKIIQKTGFDLYTLVVNWEEFRDLQLSYFKAGVVDLEVPTDHGICATWYKLVKKYKVKTILSGNNVATEAIMPPSWNYSKTDYVNLTNIHNKFGSIPLKTFPIYGLKEQLIQARMGGVKYIKPLDFLDFNKDSAKKEIQDAFGWVDYGGKHYESVFTKFYQAYILPVKFNIDKRKAHLSNLVFSGQITKSQALKELSTDLYTATDLENERKYVLKKLKMTEEEFNTYLISKPIPHAEYGQQPFLSDKYPILKLLKPFYKFFSK